MRIVILSLALALAGAPVAFAQLPKSTEVPPGQMALSDVDFMHAADAANIDQMTFAARIEGNPMSNLKSMAKDVGVSHRKADIALRLLASNKHVELSHEMTPRAQQKADDLIRRDLPTDNMYAEGLVRDNQDLIALYERARNESPDPDIRQYAETMLPALRHHERLASDFLARNGVKTGQP